VTSISTPQIDAVVTNFDGVVDDARQRRDRLGWFAAKPARRRDVIVLQHLLLGIDAHVSLDPAVVAPLGKLVASPGGLLQRAVDLVAFHGPTNVVAILDALGRVTLDV
jgi:hypothetical protein